MYSGLHFMRGSRKGSDNSRKIEKGLWPPLPLPLPPPQTIYPPHPPPHEIISWIRACIYLSTINKHHSKINKNNTRIKKSMNIKYIFWYMFIFFFISRSTSAPWKVVRWWGAFSFCVWHGGSQRRKVNIISSGSKFTQLLPRYLINLNLFLVNYLCFLHALYCFDYIT